MSSIIETQEGFKTFLQDKAVIIVTGFGSASEFDPESFEKQVKDEADALVCKYNLLYGDWVIIYGGDEISKGKTTIANVIKYIKENYDIQIVAVQSDYAKQWPPKLPNAVFYCKTDFNEKNEVIWSGYVPGTEELAGSAKVWFGKDIVAAVKEIAVFGGGPIARDEVKYALKNGIPVYYVKCKAKNTEVNGEYGSVDALFE